MTPTQLIIFNLSAGFLLGMYVMWIIKGASGTK